MASRIVAALALLVVAGIGGLAPRPARAAVLVPTGFVNDTLVAGLNQPNSFAFLPDGRVLLTEQRSAKVRLVVNNHVASTDPVLTVPSVNSTGQERGLQGITVDPAWPDSPYVYLFHNRTGGFLRLVRYTASGDVANPDGENLTLASPLLLIDDIPDATANHNAGCLRFGPDGMLYLSLGDDDNFACEAFLLTTLRGQILRMRVDQLPPGGGPQVARALLAPADNPYAANPDANAKLVFAHGMRNPWRFQIDRVTGTLYGCDVGEADFEEQNEIHAGDFMGWPYREANLSIVRGSCPEPGGVGAQPYVHPIAFYSRDENLHAITSAGMYRPAIGGNSNWPLEYYLDRGDVFYTDYYDGKLFRIRWNGSAWVPAAAVPGQPAGGGWGTGFTAASDFLVGPDGSLWWIAQFNSSFSANSGSVNRVRSTETAGVPLAVPAFRTLSVVPNPSAAAVELVFELDAATPVTLAIYDVAGRKRVTLLDEVAQAGARHVTWNGNDAGGQRVGAGIYFARLERAGVVVGHARVLRVR